MVSKLLYLLMDWETIACVRTGQRYNHSLPNIHDGNFCKNI